MAAGSERGGVNQLVIWAATTPSPADPLLVEITPSMSAKEAVAAIKQDMDILNAQVKRLRDELDLQRTMQEQVERAVFLDGSSAMHAVFANLLVEASNRVKLCEWTGCQFQGDWRDTARQLLVSKGVESELMVSIVRNCTSSTNNEALNDNNLIVVTECENLEGYNNTTAVLLSPDQAMHQIKDKSVGALMFVDGENDDAAGKLQRDLAKWMRKVRVGGVVFGLGYSVSVPFHHHQGGSSSSPVKTAVDTYRTGEDNDLGQDSSVWVAAGSLWYFAKIKPSIFG